MRFRSKASDAAARPLRQRGSRSSALRLVVRAAAIAAVLLVVVTIGLFAVLVTGPTELGFVRDRIVASIHDGLGDGYQVDAGKAVIDFDPVLGGLVIRVDDVVVSDAGNVEVARIPSTRFAINASALFALRVQVNAVELSGASFSFVRLEDGSVKLGDAQSVFASEQSAESVAPVASRDGGFPDLIVAMQILDQGMEPPIDRAIAAGFERLAMVDGTISVWDQTLNQQRRFPNSDLDITVDPDTSRLSVHFETMGFSGRWAATLERSHDEATGGRAMTAVFSQLTIADLLPSLSGNGPVSADIPLYGRANIAFDSAGQIAAASARLDLGAGVFTFEEGRESILLDEATVKLRWDIPSQALIFDPSSFFFGDTRGLVSGRIQSEGTGADRRYTFNFVSPGTVMAPRDSGLPPLVARQISVSGSAIPSQKLLNIDNASILTAEGSVAAAGSLGFEGETPSLAVAATFTPMSVKAFKQMWIPLISPGARRWAMENLEDGWIKSANFEASVPGGLLWTSARPRLPDDSMRLDMEVEDAVIRTMGKVPPITGATGTVVLAGSTFGVDIIDGVIETPSGTVSVDAGAFAIPDTSRRPANGVVEMQISGSAQALGEVADSEPILALTNRDVRPDDLTGAGTAAISVRIPLQPDLTGDDIDWKVVVNTNDVTSKVPVDGRQVSNANVELTVTPAEVGIYGTAKLDGVDADVSMALPLSASAEVAPGAQLVRVILDDAARKRLGIGLENMLGGSITALVSDGPGGGQHYDLDMERARLIIPGVGWTKGIGVPATLSFDIVEVDDGHEITNLEFSGSGFGFSGKAKLDKEYGLVSADIGQMSLREGDSISVRIARGSRGYAINARGTALNLQGLISQVKDRYEQSGGFPDLALDAKIDRLIGFNQEEIAGASLRMVSVGGETQKLSFVGTMGGEAISLEYAVAPEGTTLFGTARDTGRLMRFTDVYTRMAGGVATLNGQSGPTGPMVGTFEVSRFQVLNEPAMERVVVRNATQDGTFNPVRVTFDRMVARFNKDARSVVIEDALLRGADVGATFTGRYDIPSTNVVMTGTYLPAYAFNNLFSQIPILGLALGGGFREGLIGVTFKIEGPIRQPAMFFNPLSAVAPGIFRKIFEFQ